MNEQDKVFYIDLYLDLMKKAVTGALAPRHFSLDPAQRLVPDFKDKLAQHGLVVVRELSEQEFEEGLGWPTDALTMIGRLRIENLYRCIVDVLKNDVPGDFIETGVWRGGSVIFMRAALKAFGATDRTVWVADSFEGLPAPNTEKYPADTGSNLHTIDELRVSLEQVQNNFRLLGLLDDQVKFLKGWFRDTLPHAPMEKLAIMRLDGDLYESTMDGLVNLYPKLSPGGFCIIDDFALRCCSQAVNDYRAEHGIEDPLIPVDSICVYWQKSG